MSDITLAASANAFQKLFEDIVSGFSFSKSDTATYGPFSASYAVDITLSGGSVALNNNDTIDVSDLEIVFDTLTAGVCFTLPGWCVGGFCIVPDPWNGCLVSFPGFCIGGFSLCPEIDLSGLVSEVTAFDAGLRVAYYVDPARPPGVTDVEAEILGHPNKWQLYIKPTLVDINPIDVPATIANLLENAVKSAIESAIPSWVPGWAVDLLWDIIGPIVDVIVSALGIVGDIADWFEQLLDDTFNLLAIIETAVADYFAAQYPIYQLDDPYPVLPATGGLIPVTIPIRNLTATIDAQELVVLADVGVLT
jgi:hypothetical protein